MAIITASKVVTDRLDFLRGFNTFLFDADGVLLALWGLHGPDLARR